MGNYDRSRVVITGIGIISPNGIGREKSWESTLEGKSGVDEISLFDASTFDCKIAGEVKDFSLDQLPLKDKKIKKYINRGAGFGIGASFEALEDAGLLGNNKIDRARLGVSIGNSGYRPLLKEWKEIAEAYENNFSKMPYMSISTFLKNKYHTGAELISIIHQAKAFNYSISTACTSGTQSIGLAYRMIQNGNADIVISGGFDSMINEVDLMSFCRLGAVTTDFNNNPKKASRPFSKTRSGFVLGEGGAILVLEKLEHAIARKVNIYAEIIGFGNTLSAYSMTDPPPNGDGAYSSMKKAIYEAKLEKHNIDYINMHGTSTVDNDKSETMSVKRLFGEKAYSIPLSSTKSSTGHLIAGAGAIEVAFCALAIRDKIIPPTINLDSIDGQCDLDYTPNIKREKEINYAISNSLGFGGSNSSIVIKKYNE